VSTDLLFSVNGVIDFNRQPTKWEVRKHSEQTQFRFIEPVISFWYTFYGLVPDIDIPTYDLRTPQENS
jgi:DNA mismatch repair ATPase MutL